jgi:DNA-binding PadR family transcriptional regulator
MQPAGTPTRGTGARISANEAVVLGMLARGSSSASGLVRRIGRSVGYFWSPARSHVFGLLPRLVEDGYVTRTTTPGPEEGPDRQVYAVTASGRAAVRAWLASPALLDGPTRNPFLLKVFFGGILGRDEIVAHLRAGREAIAAQLDELEQIEAAIDADGDRYGWLALRYGLERNRATLRWADEALTALGEEPA